MHQSDSVYLSVLDNQWAPFTTHSFNHDLEEPATCQLFEQLPGIKQLKQNYPQVNIDIHSTQIKQLKQGIYIGQLNSEGKPQGYGMIRYQDNSIVEAHFKDGKATGKGFKWFGQDWYYVGDFVENCFDGRGEYKSPQISYVGQFKNNTFHGHGQLTLAKNHGKFIGQMENGQMKEGTLTWQLKNPKYNKQILKFQYKGTFKDGQFHGSNCSLQSNVGVYKGSFKDGQKSGPGRFEYKEKYQYVGNYYKNVKSGYGTLYNPEIKIVKDEEFPELSELERNISYRGEFQNNLPHGKGQIYKEAEGKLVSADYVEGIWTQALKSLSD